MLIKVIKFVIFVFEGGILVIFWIMINVVIDRIYGMILVIMVRLISMLNWLFSDGLMVISVNLFWIIIMVNIFCIGVFILVIWEKILGK